MFQPDAKGVDSVSSTSGLRVDALPCGDSQRAHAKKGVIARLLVHGVDDLETSELLATIVDGPWSGTTPVAFPYMEGGLARLARASIPDLRSRLGLSQVQAVRLSAALALGRRLMRESVPTRASVCTPRHVHDLLWSEIVGLDRETFHVLVLDGKHRLRRHERVSEGTLTTSLVHPREVFGIALRDGAAALIVAHNHPSGDPEPSGEDLAVTRRLVSAGKLVGVPLLDHVVVAAGGFVSMRERIDFDAI